MISTQAVEFAGCPRGPLNAQWFGGLLGTVCPFPVDSTSSKTCVRQPPVSCTRSAPASPPRLLTLPPTVTERLQLASSVIRPPPGGWFEPTPPTVPTDSMRPLASKLPSKEEMWISPPLHPSDVMLDPLLRVMLPSTTS